MLPLIISYYTDDFLYIMMGEQLKSSCERFGIEYDIQMIPSRGSWEKNCFIKPKFILERLKMHKRPVLWVDADSMINAPIEPLPIFMNHFGVHIQHHLETTHPSKVLSGTVYVNYTDMGVKIVEEWVQKVDELCENGTTIWDQIPLSMVVQQAEYREFVSQLPMEYNYIYDKPVLDTQLFKPVIISYQASRVAKKIGYESQS